MIKTVIRLQNYKKIVIRDTSNTQNRGTGRQQTSKRENKRQAYREIYTTDNKAFGFNI